MQDAAADLIGVLDGLGLDRAHVVGLSYGGGIAQTAALAYPDRFESLVLAATTDYPSRRSRPGPVRPRRTAWRLRSPPA